MQIISLTLSLKKSIFLKIVTNIFFLFHNTERNKLNVEKLIDVLCIV